MSSTRDQLENELRRFNIDQIKETLNRTTGVRLEDLVDDRNPIPIVVTNLINALIEQDRLLFRFIANLMSPGTKPLSLRRAARSYGQEMFKLTVREENPFWELVVMNEPFVDRKEVRKKLEEFVVASHSEPFSNQVFLTQGERYTGRSHVQFLINAAANFYDARMIYIDLLSCTVQDVIWDLINQMQLPPSEFRDRMQQASTQVKGFIQALKGISVNFPGENKRWFLVFDHYDRPEITTEVREMIDALIQNCAESRFVNTWIFVLGYGVLKPQFRTITHKISSIDLVPIQTEDVKQYLTDWAAENGQPMSEAEVNNRAADVFKDLAMPLDGDGMFNMANRIRSYIQ